jgi:ketosteroid isomerase-like protein
MTMTPPAPAAVAVAQAYFQAWSAHDFESAMRFVDPDVVCLAPAGRLEGGAAFRGFMGPFVDSVERTALIAQYGDDECAVTMYDTDTHRVQDAPGAECVRVRDGRIVWMRIIFDRLPFRPVAD